MPGPDVKTDYLKEAERLSRAGEVTPPPISRESKVSPGPKLVDTRKEFESKFGDVELPPDHQEVKSNIEYLEESLPRGLFPGDRGTYIRGPLPKEGDIMLFEYKYSPLDGVRIEEITYPDGKIETWFFLDLNPALAEGRMTNAKDFRLYSVQPDGQLKKVPIVNSRAEPNEYPKEETRKYSPYEFLPGVVLKVKDRLEKGARIRIKVREAMTEKRFKDLKPGIDKLFLTYQAMGDIVLDDE